MIGCGEYGTEGLDYADLMKRRYPSEWLKKDEEGNWFQPRLLGHR